MTPTLVALRNALPPEGALVALVRPGGNSCAPKRSRGFTLIELLVAIGAMALMAGLSWRGIDGIAEHRADEVHFARSQRAFAAERAGGGAQCAMPSMPT